MKLTLGPAGPGCPGAPLSPGFPGLPSAPGSPIGPEATSEPCRENQCTVYAHVHVHRMAGNFQGILYYFATSRKKALKLTLVLSCH